MHEASQEMVVLHGRTFVVIATVHTDREEKLVVDARSGHPVVSVCPDGRTSLPSSEALNEINAVRTQSASSSSGAVANARMELELQMLDAAGVKNGSKAIWLWLNANWTDDLRKRFGDFDDPATIKRWRTQLRRLRAVRSNGRPA